MTAAALPCPPNPAERLAEIIDTLCKAVAAHGARGVLTAALQVLLWSRLSRMGVRARRLAGRIAAGAPLPAARPRAPSIRPPRPYARLPQSLLWLVRAVPGTAAGASQLRFLLAEPQMADIANTPPMRRLLRPLCRMLGVQMPPPAPPAPKPAEAAPPPQDATSPPWPEPPSPSAAAPPPAPPVVATPPRAA